jgi:hypothetical protein
MKTHKRIVGGINIWGERFWLEKGRKTQINVYALRKTFWQDIVLSHATTKIYMHTHTHTHIHIHMQIHTYTYTHLHTYKCTHTHTHLYIHTHIYSNTHIHTHTYTYIHTHIASSTRTYQLLSPSWKLSVSLSSYCDRTDLQDNPNLKTLHNMSVQWLLNWIFTSKFE